MTLLGVTLVVVVVRRPLTSVRVCVCVCYAMVVAAKGGLGAKKSSLRRGQGRRGSKVVVSAQLSGGSNVRVVKPVKIYHVGKFKEGLDLEGRVGVVMDDVRKYEGQELSATLPWKVQFEVEHDGGASMVKVVAHLDDDEIEEH